MVIFFSLKGLKNATAPHQLPKNVSVEVTQKQAGRERVQGQKGREGNPGFALATPHADWAGESQDDHG